jgi:hypothetical protein
MIPKPRKQITDAASIELIRFLKRLSDDSSTITAPMYAPISEMIKKITAGMIHPSKATISGKTSHQPNKKTTLAPISEVRNFISPPQQS